MDSLEVPRCTGNPVVQTISLFSRPTAFLEAAQRDHGDVFSVRVVGMGEVVLLCDPDHIREYFAQPEDTLSPSDAYKYQFDGIIDPSAVLFKDGAPHSEHHRALTSFMGRHAGLEQVPTIRDLLIEDMERWPYDKTFSLLPYIARHANRVLLRIIAGNCGPALEETLLDDADDFLDLANSPLTFVRPLRAKVPGSPWARLGQVRARFHRNFEARFSTLGADEKCVVRSMIDEGVSRPQICEEVLTLFHSGQTMQKAPVWPVAFLLANSAAEARLRQELSRTLGDRPIESKDFRELPYLAAVVAEGIRHAEIVPFTAPRIARRDLTLGGYRIRRGAWVAQCVGYTRVRPESFRDPYHFTPEHFVERAGRSAEWVPFGHGKRVCVGKGISEIYMAVVLATLFQRERLALDGSIEPERSGGLRVPRGGLRLRRRRPRSG